MTGHNKIRMDDLLTLFKESGFNDSETFIQSGNVIFSYNDKEQEKDLINRIESGIRLKFGYEIAAFIRTSEEIKEIVKRNPFLSEKKFDPSRSAVIFLHEKPGEAQTEKVKNVDYPPDKFSIIGREIFIYCPNGFGRTKLYTNFFENKMKVKGTARNWNTILKIMEMAENRH